MPFTLAQRTQQMNPSVIREILKVTERPGIISLAGGLPSPDTFPVQAMQEACARVLSQDGHAALQYAASEGLPVLREWVAQELRGQGLEVHPDQVLITTGSQQGLDLVGKVLIDAGSKILVEKPTYLGLCRPSCPCNPRCTAWRATMRACCPSVWPLHRQVHALSMCCPIFKIQLGV